MPGLGLGQPYDDNAGSLGMGLRPSQVNPYLPNQSQVDQAYAEQAQEEPNFFFKLLQVPERIFGGQSIKGFVEGTARGGLGEGLRKLLVNNPLNQLLEAIPGVDGLVEDTSFQDIRNSLGWKSSGNAMLDTAINIIGDTVLDPFGLMWTPFGKIGAAAKGAAVIPASLAEATQGGLKTLLAFRVPFSESGFAVPMFKSLDVRIAKTIDGAADFMNRNPVTAAILNTFSARGAIKGNAAQRSAVSTALDTADVYAGNTVLEQQLPQIAKKLFDTHPEVFRGEAPVQTAMMALSELGVRSTDDFHTITGLIEGGKPFAVGRWQRDKILDGTADFLAPHEAAYAKRLAAGMERAVADGNMTELGGLVSEWQANFDRAMLPNSVRNLPSIKLKQAEIELRRGIDVIDPLRGQILTREQKMSQIAQATGVPQTPEQAARGVIAQELNPQVVAQQAAEKQLFGWIQDVDSGKFEGVTLEKLTESAEMYRGLMESVGRQDQMSGFIDMLSEPAVPRILTREVRDAIDAQGYKFTKGRRVSEMSTLEWIKYVHDNGSFLTNYQPIKYAVLEDASKSGTVWDAMSKIFPEDFVKKLRKLPGGEDAAQFFETNPAYAFYRRLEGSISARRFNQINKSLTEKGSPLWAMETTGEDLAKNPGLLQQQQDLGRRAVIITEDAEKIIQRPANPGELMNDALQLNNRAAAMIYKDRSRSYVLGKIRATEGSLNDVLRQESATLKNGLHNHKEWKATEFAETDLGRNLGAQVDFRARLEGLEKQAVEEAKRIGGVEAKELEAARAQRIKTAETADAAKALEVYGPDHPLTTALQALEAKRSGGIVTVGEAAAKARADKIRSRVIESINSEVGQGLHDLSKARPETLSEISRLRDITENLAAKEGTIRGAHAEVMADLANDATKHVSRLRQKLAKAEKKIGDTATSVSHKKLNEEFYYLKRFQEQGVLPIDELKRDAPELLDEILKNQPQTRIGFMESDLHESVFGDNGVLKRLSKPDTLKQTLGVLDGMTSWWKSWTALAPPFIATRGRDWMTTLIMMTQGGANPFRMAASMGDAKAVAGAVKGFLAGDQAAGLGHVIERTVNGVRESITAREVMDSAFRWRNLNNSIIRDEINDTLSKAASLSGVKDTSWRRLLSGDPEKNPIIGLGVEMNDALDNHSRLSGIIAKWKSGASLDEANQFARQWTYNPSRVDLSWAERYVLRRFLPFYSWTKTAVKTQMHALATKPSTVGFFERFHRAAQDASGMDPLEFDATVPEFVKDNLGIPTKVDEKGLSFRMFGGFIPVGDLFRLTNAISDMADPRAEGNFLDYFGERLNPVMKVVAENALNRSFFSQRKLEFYDNQKVEMYGIPMSPKTKNLFTQIRFLNEIDNLNILNFNDIEAMLKIEGVTRPNRGDMGILDRFLGSSFSPLPFGRSYSVATTEQVTAQENRTKAQISLDKGLLRKELERGSPVVGSKNIEALQKVIASDIARLEAVQNVKRRIGGDLLRR